MLAVIRLAVALASVVLSAQLAGAQEPPPSRPEPPGPRAGPTPAQIDRNGTLILIRSTLLALDHANRTGNYTVLRDLGAPQFQAVNTAARLGEIFASQRAQNLDLSGVAVLDPQLTVLPEIGANGLMRMAGFFPSVPVQVNFELTFAPVEGRWRVFGIGINVGQAAPTPAPNEAAKPEPKPDSPKAPVAKPGPVPRAPRPAQPPAPARDP